MKPVITVVVPVLNEEAHLEGCLRSLRAQTFRDYELVVVDNGSTDASVHIAQRYADRVLYEPKVGPDLARHRGFVEARTELLASADADTIYPPDWLERLVHTLEKKNVVGVFGPLGFKESSHIPRQLEILGYTLLAFLMYPLGVPLAGASNFGCRKSAYLAVGGFPPLAHLANADFRLARRLRRVGRVVFVPALRAYTSNRTFVELGVWRAVLHTLRIWVDIALERDRVPSAHYLAVLQRNRGGQ
ncbi:MAG: glycosyltransferase family 2 protein [Candidatus Bipolaricaulota bacterium]|nr:glycosyltransferase family 2 protein [Candidatus Bipolaricaulota bacterium]MDW8127230.1 glycosyltransferase family A protein [Candidatus Bipolaricaulota bacterium]